MGVAAGWREESALQIASRPIGAGSPMAVISGPSEEVEEAEKDVVEGVEGEGEGSGSGGLGERDSPPGGGGGLMPGGGGGLTPGGDRGLMPAGGRGMFGGTIPGRGEPPPEKPV